MKIIIVCILTLAAVIVPVKAAEASGELQLYTADDFSASAITDALPQDIKDELPTKDIYSAESMTETFTAGFFLRFIKKTAAELLAPALKTMTAVLGMLFAASVLAKLKEMFSSHGVSAVFEIASGLCVMLTLFGTQTAVLESVKEYLTRLTAIVGAFVPVTAAISVAGGNIGSAAVSANGMMLGVYIVQMIAARILFPVIELCFGLCAASGMGGGLKLGEISKIVRGTAIFIFSVIGAVISAVMTFQTSIASRSDSLSIRAAKFAASHSIPVVGSIASDAVGAVAESLSLVKSCVGFGGVILIVLVTLPIIVRILLTRLGLVISRTAADILGLDREKSIISDMCGLLEFMAAVSVISALMFVYAAALFAVTASAAV